MEIYSLNTDNCTTLSANYSFDQNIQFLKNTLFTENNIFFNLENALQTPNDTTINNYSNLHLTDAKNIGDIIQIKPLEYLDDESFSTYLAANALYNITDQSRYWVAEEPAYSATGANVAVSGISESMDNSYYFEITLLDDFKCKIAHENDGVKRFLTVDATGNLSFYTDANLDYMGEYSPQIFLYVYDRKNDLITFLKNLNDIIFYVSFDSINEELGFTQTLTGADLRFTSSTTFRCQARQDTSNITPIDDPWVSYNKTINSNILVNKSHSFQNLPSNVLINSQYYNISSTTLDVNALSLKNSNTPENYQSRANPFFQEKETFMREYKKLFTGSNQELGDENISLDYESYTSNILLKKDKITYFHVPQIFYPFKTLNINDSKLAESGAIAGDHPMKSDKIFKKKADYKFTSFFGNTRLENTGSFLCAWLSGNSNPLSRPVWVDRYYFPSKISFLGALTASNFNAIEYTPFYDCLRGIIPENINTIDKISDVIFEPGTYYAYYHIGQQYSKDYIKYLNNHLIQKDFDNNYFTTADEVLYPVGSDSEYIFDGNKYCISSNLSSIQDSNQFTLIFDGYSNDWSKPFGYQLLGNYSTDGFGVFNINQVTPALFINGLSSITVTNLNFKPLNTIETPASATAIIRLETFDDFYIFDNAGNFIRYNNRFSKIYQVSNPAFRYIYDYDYDEECCYVLCADPFNLTKLYRITFATGLIYEILPDTDNQYTYYFLNCTSTNASTINKKQNSFYFTRGDKAERYKNDIYFRISSQNNFGLYKWSIKYNSTLSNAVKLILSAYNSFEDFDLDIDGNLWALYDFNKYAKITSNNVLMLSGSFPLSSYQNTNIDFGYNITDNNELGKFTFISGVSTLSTINTQIIVNKLDNNTGNILNTYILKQRGINKTSITQSSFLRYYFSDLYFGNVLNVKLKLKPFVDLASLEQENINFIYGLSALSPGYHNFVFRLNSNGGTFHFFIDGQIMHEEVFMPKKYKFSNLINRPFFFGTTAYSNSIPLFEFLDDNSFNCKNINIKNFYLYNKALNYFDILFHNRMHGNVEDINFDLSCGRRNYLEEIERYFKFRTPGSKSTLFNVVLRNSGINNPVLKNEIEKRIYSLLAKTAPAYTKVNSIKWSE